MPARLGLSILLALAAPAVAGSDAYGLCGGDLEACAVEGTEGSDPFCEQGGTGAGSDELRAGGHEAGARFFGGQRCGAEPRVRSGDVLLAATTPAATASWEWHAQREPGSPEGGFRRHVVLAAGTPLGTAEPFRWAAYHDAAGPAGCTLAVGPASQDCNLGEAGGLGPFMVRPLEPPFTWGGLLP